MFGLSRPLPAAAATLAELDTITSTENTNIVVRSAAARLLVLVIVFQSAASCWLSLTLAPTCIVVQQAPENVMTRAQLGSKCDPGCRMYRCRTVGVVMTGSRKS